MGGLTDEFEELCRKVNLWLFFNITVLKIIAAIAFGLIAFLILPDAGSALIEPTGVNVIDTYYRR